MEELAPVSSNVVRHHSVISRAMREASNGHKGCVLWFTGLSGAGKSTLAHALEEELFGRQCQTCVLDGDNVRHGLCGDLGFSREDRQENIRRIAEMAKLFVETGTIVMTAFISPFREDRRKARSVIGERDFIEIFCDCPTEICESRDVKGHYKKARAGLIPEFTGITSPYETPENPDCVIDTSKLSLQESVGKIVNLLELSGLFLSDHFVPQAG
ncbi:MAG: adenylyl-sulfate kinase [Rhodocyclaceae bacterium]